jgi:hypothetical protein
MLPNRIYLPLYSFQFYLFPSGKAIPLKNPGDIGFCHGFLVCQLPRAIRDEQANNAFSGMLTPPGYF